MPRLAAWLSVVNQERVQLVDVAPVHEGRLF
jgi:hypothetical protein